MFRKFFSIILVAAVLLFNISFMANPVFASPASDKALAGLETSAGSAGLATDKADPTEIIGKAISVLLSILGLIFLIVVVYGGITWMTAAGNPEDIKKARNMIIEGAIGMALTLAAYSVAYYVVQAIASAVQ